MNCILLEDEDFVAGGGRVRLTGRRLRHVREIHRAAPGDELVVGRLGGRLGTGRVVHLDDSSLDLEVLLDRDPPSPLPLTLVLAVPRPIVLRRVLISVTVLGIKHLILVNSRRVEKSYWQSGTLESDRIDAQCRLGLELAGDTRLPTVELKRRFRPFVEDELPALGASGPAFVAHPEAAAEMPRAVEGPTLLAVGPEGGFVPYEIERLAASGLQPVRLGGAAGARVLNVETAIPALVARLL